MMEMEKSIYVAGASAQIELIELYMDKLRVAGWTITFDWAVKVREVGNASPDDPKIRREAALADLEGVLAARVMWLVQPDATSTSTGAWVELGSAITKRVLMEKLATIFPLQLGPLRKREEGYVISQFEKTAKLAGIGPVTVVASGSSMKCIFSDLADYRFQSHDDALDFIVKDLGRMAE
jgi:hypothetical protein